MGWYGGSGDPWGGMGVEDGAGGLWGKRMGVYGVCGGEYGGMWRSKRKCMRSMGSLGEDGGLWRSVKGYMGAVEMCLGSMGPMEVYGGAVGDVGFVGA